MMAAFVMINLIVREIVNNAQKISQEISEETEEIKAATSEIEDLIAVVKELKAMVQQLLGKEEKQPNLRRM